MSKLELLPGDYIAGFVDGEGCFYLTYRSETRRERAGSPTYFRWTPYFTILLREDDLEILKQIQRALACGKIYHMKGGQVSVGIQNINDLFEKVVPFFIKYPLRAKKKNDFNLWCKALEIVYKNKCNKTSCSVQDSLRLTELRQQMKEIKAIGSKEYKNQVGK
jgi:intein-encoded DNA endonuclease-like protein